MSKTSLMLSFTAAAGLALGAPAALHAAADHDSGHDHEERRPAHTHGFAFGQPADGAEPGRTIEITATDSMEFAPSEIEVETGETVRFVVKNTGRLHHSFTIGSRQWHRDHEQQMQGVAPEDLVSHMRDEPNGTVVPPGETRTLTWTFDERTVVQIGCHVPGHFPAGMKGEVEVS